MSLRVSSCTKYILEEKVSYSKKKEEEMNHFQRRINCFPLLVTFEFHSLYVIKARSCYQANRSQMHQHSLLLYFFFLFSVFFWAAERDGVYLILLRWHTRLGSDKRASGAVLIQISACSQ